MDGTEPGRIYMEDNEREQERRLRSDTGEQQFVILNQLLQSAAQMQHVDELFIWLTREIMQRMRIEVVQIWTMESAPANQAPAVLRATSFYDSSIQMHVIVNSHVTDVVRELLNRQQAILSQPVGNLFSSHQSRLLGRYGLYYCVCCATMSNLALPPASDSIFVQTTGGPSIVAALLFLAQPRPQQFAITINQLLEQALQIAKTQGLLQTSSIHDAIAIVPDVQQQHSLPPLHELIPVRTRSRDSMRSGNPFTSAAAISDKRALAFLSAVDGSRTVAEIAALRKMEGKDMVAALRLLLQQERIQLYTREGQLIEGGLFFNMP